MQKILYTSAQVRQAINQLFSSSKKRRVVITAFVGEGAEKFLPRPNGLRLICWAKAGGTNPNALRKLKQRGVRVEFANNLHMKVYWTQDQGAVLTSANLSTNALGAGNLKEIGVLLEPGEFDIDRAIRLVKPHPWSAKIILDLERQHNKLATSARELFPSRKPSPDFIEWLNSPDRPEWKLGAITEWANISPSSNAKLRSKEVGETEPYDFFQTATKEFHDGEWILTFDLKGRSPTNTEWMYADCALPISKTDKAYDSERPFEVLQFHAPKYYTTVERPFCINPKFRKAFAKALRQFPVSRIEGWTKPSGHLLALIRKYY
jgi:hypothetical protein